MKALVTGGAGFIGSHVGDLLVSQGHEVHVLDDLSNGKEANVPAGATLHVGSICDAALVNKLFAEIRPDVVCHLLHRITKQLRVPLRTGMRIFGRALHEQQAGVPEQGIGW